MPSRSLRGVALRPSPNDKKLNMPVTLPTPIPFKPEHNNARREAEICMVFQSPDEQGAILL